MTEIIMAEEKCKTCTHLRNVDDDEINDAIGTVQLNEGMALEGDTPICEECLQYMVDEESLNLFIDLSKEAHGYGEEGTEILGKYLKPYIDDSPSNPNFKSLAVFSDDLIENRIYAKLPPFFSEKEFGNIVKKLFKKKKRKKILEGLLDTSKIVLKELSDAELKFLKTYHKNFNMKSKFPKGNKLYIVEEFLPLLNHPDNYKENLLVPEHMAKYFDLTKIHKAEPEIFDCQEFPSTEGIFRYRDDCFNYFVSKKIFVSRKLINKLLLTIERDTPFIAYSEPGFGKSAIVKTFLDWVTTDEYYEDIDLDGNKIMVKGYNQYLNPHVTFHHRLHGYGMGWKSMNVGSATSPLNLFGGIAPEAIGNPKGIGAREQNTEMGIISKCILHKHHLYLDEINRTEPENLDRLMGALQEPNYYEVPEANWRFVFKDKSRGIKRSNMIFASTMNTGDVGNFQLPFAFKRRFKIIPIKYSTKEVIQIFDLVQSNSTSTTSPYTPAELSELQDMLGGNRMNIELLETWVKYIHDILSAIHTETNAWVEDQYIPFGIGIAHLFNFFQDLAIYILVMFLDEYGKMSMDELESLFDEKIQTSASSKAKAEIFFGLHINTAVKEAFNEHIFMSLVDESDDYTINQISSFVAELTMKTSESFTRVLIQILYNDQVVEDTDTKLLETEFPNVLKKLLKFDSSIPRIHASFY